MLLKIIQERPWQALVGLGKPFVFYCKYIKTTKALYCGTFVVYRLIIQCKILQDFVGVKSSPSCDDNKPLCDDGKHHRVDGLVNA